MTKMQMSEALVSSPAWDGEKRADVLCRCYTKQEIKDAYDQIADAERDYFEWR